MITRDPIHPIHPQPFDPIQPPQPPQSLQPTPWPPPHPDAPIKNLFNLSTFLTKRDAWAGSFHELLLDIPRSDDDLPLHLPDAPKPAAPWDPPPGSDNSAGGMRTTTAHPPRTPTAHPPRTHPAHISHTSRTLLYSPPPPHHRLLTTASSPPPPHHRLLATAGPGHCSAWDGATAEEQCAGPKAASLKQKRNVRLLSDLTGTPLPDLDAMSAPQARSAALPPAALPPVALPPSMSIHTYTPSPPHRHRTHPFLPTCTAGRP